MRTILVSCVCCAAALVFGVSEARAAGFGMYGSLGGDRSSSWSGDYVPGFDAATEHQGAGLMFDTAVARDGLFNYHLDLGYDEFTNSTTGAVSDLKLGGLMISNAFGFGIVRTARYRLWLGPEVRIARARGSIRGYDYDFGGVGAGPVLGLNFNLAGALSFMVKAGYQIMNYTGTADSSRTYESYDYDIKERLLYVNIGILFRTSGDIF